MYIKNYLGDNIVCDHIFPISEIKSGQKWKASGGFIVDIISVENNKVTYSWIENNKIQKHIKDSFNFQCRYCLIIK